MRRTVKLTTQEDLKIYMSPQRQKILRHMRLLGDPLTSKAVATAMGISTSSAQFHLRKLEQLGVVELDHTEMINGIKAMYFALSDVDISIGTDLDGHPSRDKFLIYENIVKDTFSGLLGLYESDITGEELAGNSDFLSGTIHLTGEEAREFLDYIRNFLQTHERKREGTQPWEYAMMLYNAGMARED